MSNLPIFYLIATILFTSVAQLLQKHAANTLAEPEPGKLMLNNLSFIASGFFLGVSLIAWLQVLDSVAVSIAYPLLSLNYALVLLLARWVFDEPVPKERWIGVVCIVAGVVVLSSGSTL